MAETTKAPTTKAPTRKTAGKKSTTKKATAKKTTTERTRTAPRTAARPEDAEERRGPKGMEAAVRGAHQLVELTGKEFEGIVGVAKGDDGWSVQVEVLEMRRIPSTTDVLAVYDVDVDSDGDLVGYHRADRYVRGSAGEERS